MVNFHTHTYRCNHAAGEDREYVEAAIQAGYKVLGFSDHCPNVYPDGYVSDIRMKLSEIDGYFDSLTSLRDEYKNDIKIYIGYENEYIPELLYEQDKILSEYPIDFLIQGQHSIRQENYSPYTGIETLDKDILYSYTKLAVNGIKSGRYLYLAHPDLINFKGDSKMYEECAHKICKTLKEYDKPYEFNMLGYWQKRHYPVEAFIDIASEYKLKAIIGTDAHDPGELLKTREREKATSLLKEKGFEIIEYDYLLSCLEDGSYKRPYSIVYDM